MLARAVSCGLDGVMGFLVNVEAFLSHGLPGLDIVGLPSAAVKESKDRVRAALKVCGYPWPPQRVTINLSPADVKKEGSGFDLAIALAVLAAEDPKRLSGIESTLLLGELTLEGRLMPVRGALGMVISAAEQGMSGVILPRQNAREVECIGGISIYPAETLREVYDHLSGQATLEQQPVVSYNALLNKRHDRNNLRHVRGQAIARKALEVAAAGGHNLLMVGVPGSGKTMLARCLPGVLPPLTYREALETTLIHSAAGEMREDAELLTQRPFRAPHHNISMPAMIGGGTKARPGEVSLAHNGVLFLDELPEFPRQTLEALRQPLEDGFVNVMRVNAQFQYQSRCMLVAGMNPCPCGNHGSQMKECRCSAFEIKRYLSKISGPLLDRMDMQVEMDAISVGEIESSETPEDSEAVQARVLRARKLQEERYQDEEYFCNAQLSQEGVERHCIIESDAKALLMQAVERFHISMRAYGRMHKVARTLADLAEHERISVQDIAQAIQFRNVDSRYWR